MDLLATLHFMTSELETNGDAYPLLRAAHEDWRNLGHQYGPGVIPFDLERHLPDPEARRQMTTLLAAVRAAVVKYGEAVPAAVLNARWRDTGVRFFEFRTEFILTTVGPRTPSSKRPCSSSRRRRKRRRSRRPSCTRDPPPPAPFLLALQAVSALASAAMPNHSRLGRPH